MRRALAGPLSRPVNVERLPKDRATFTIEATQAECAALAADFGLVALRDLVGRFALKGSPARLNVGGTVEATVTQTCTVSLEPFETSILEAVDVDFTRGDGLPGVEIDDLDLPDPIVNGRIDLGALTAEFLALGLDPYPRKPGVAFDPVVDETDRPLAALGRFRDGTDRGNVG